MIKNEQQYKLSLSQAAKFSSVIKSFRETASMQSTNLIREKAYIDACTSQHEELIELIRGYEELKSKNIKEISLSTFDELPIALIKSRIALGLTQRDLAERLGMKEQQIQRYESTDYSSASIERIKQIISALGIKVKETVTIPDIIPNWNSLFESLNKIGIKKDFLINKILPSRFCQSIENNINNLHLYQAANIIGKVFNISPNALLTEKNISFNPENLYRTRFKNPTNDVYKIAPYTLYAQTLAISLLDATSHLTIQPIPNDFLEFRREIIRLYKNINFENTLKYIWHLGIPVLPLKDSSYFHGACWRVSGRNVIVLKQKTKSSSRWLYDLLHEVKHTAQHPELLDFDIIEWEENFSYQRANDEDEVEANQFAAQVLLDGRASDLAKQAILDAKNNLKLLKQSTIKIAKENNINSGDLANYLAFRLSKEQNHNWWGTAQNIQESDDFTPWEITRDLLMANIDLNKIPEFEKEMLLSALN